MKCEKQDKSWYDITFEIIGSKWNLSIIGVLRNGPKRFTEIQKNICIANSKTITNHLKFLEKHKIVTRTVYPEVPPRVEYNLTDLGKKLCSYPNGHSQMGQICTFNTRN